MKINGAHLGPYVLLETDLKEDKEAGLEVISEVVSTKALRRTGGKIPVNMCNTSSFPVILKVRMSIGQVVLATPLPLPKKGKEIPVKQF